MIRVIFAIILALLGMSQTSNVSGTIPVQSESFEDQIVKAALQEFDDIYNTIELEVTIITRKCGKYDAAPKRQIIIKRDGKFVGGKVIGYATSYHFLDAFE